MGSLKGLFLVLAFLGCRSEDEAGEKQDSSLEPIAAYDSLDYVDPFIATGGIGAEIASVSPGATRPFGMTYVGPDTRADYGAPGFYHCAGYHWEDTYISSFSHTHALGMGVTDYGGIAVMPQLGWQATFSEDKGRQLAFSHAEEWAEAGSYGVRFEEPGIEVAIAASRRGAHHVYTFESGEPTLIVDLGHALGEDSVAESWITVDGSSGEITGFQNLKGSYSQRFGGLKTWFYGTVDPLPTSLGVWTGPDELLAGVSTAEGEGVGAWLRFPEGTEQVELRLSISYVDVAGAEANYDAELRDGSWEALAEAGREAWRSELGDVRVRGGSEAERRIFHSGMYRAYIMPSLFSDVDGRYRGLDGQVHEAEFPYYTDFSLWDTFRTLHPWLILAKPARQTDMLRSLAQMTADGGSVPRWPLGHGYTSGMIGTPADQVFAESWLKGLRDWPADEVFAASWAHAQGPQADAGRGGILSYVERGYVAADETSVAASKTLEYAWSDHALAGWATGMGRAEEAAVLAEQANFWRNTWDPDQDFFAARRSDGSFVELEGEFVWDAAFVEGNAWHYRWGVPFDVRGMVDVQHGGDEEGFLEDFAAYWSQVYAEEDDYLPDDWYWHGNEPDLHYAYLASTLGHWSASSEAIVWVLDNRYSDGPVGLDGNDDGGTLSAWYLFSAMGFYPIAGTDQYVVGRPIFERVEIDVDGVTTVIRAPSSADRARLTQGLERNGSQWTEATVSHEDLLGAEWLFDLD
jgi:predicted alpha-1,2-mannosidase